MVPSAFFFSLDSTATHFRFARDIHWVFGTGMPSWERTLSCHSFDESWSTSLRGPLILRRHCWTAPCPAAVNENVVFALVPAFGGSHHFQLRKTLFFGRVLDATVVEEGPTKRCNHCHAGWTGLLLVIMCSLMLLFPEVRFRRALIRLIPGVACRYNGFFRYTDLVRAIGILLQVRRPGQKGYVDLQPKWHQPWHCFHHLYEA